MQCSNAAAKHAPNNNIILITHSKCHQTPHDSKKYFSAESRRLASSHKTFSHGSTKAPMTAFSLMK